MRKARRWVAEWALIVGGGAFVIAFGDAIWRHSVPLWPGGGFAFGATAGFLLLPAWSVAGTAYRGAQGLRTLSVQAAGLWGLAALASAVGMLSTAAVLALIPGRNGERLGSLAQDEPMWVEEHDQVVWALLLGLAVGGLLLALRRGKGRRRRQDGRP